MLRRLWQEPLWRSDKCYRRFIWTLRRQSHYYPYGTLIRSLIFGKQPSRHTRYMPHFSSEDLSIISNYCNNVKELAIEFTRKEVFLLRDSMKSFLKKCTNLTKLEFTIGESLVDSSWMQEMLQPVREGKLSNLRY